MLTAGLNSTDFDAYVLLVNSSLDTLIADDDDSGGGTNSLLSQNLAAGDYVIAANTFFEGETGNYTLEMGFVPEPESWMMLTAGAGFLGLLHRRRAR